VTGNGYASILERSARKYLKRLRPFMGRFYFLEVLKMEEKKLIEKLRELAPDGRISCSDARGLAEKLKVHPSEVGKACDEAKIKIYACELGCF
jgi:hypothetical protein